MEKTFIKNEYQGTPGFPNKPRVIGKEYVEVGDEWPIRDDYEEFYEEHRIMKANVMVEYDKLRSRFDDAQISRLKNKVNNFIRLMADLLTSAEVTYSISSYVDNAVNIRFRDSKALLLTIYDNHLDDDETDFEEAFLTYIDNSASRLVYGSLPQIVELLKTEIKI